MKAKLDNMYSFEDGSQVSDSSIKKWHKEINESLEDSKEEIAIRKIASGNGFVIGIKKGNTIEITEVKNGYIQYEYEEEEEIVELIGLSEIKPI